MAKDTEPSRELTAYLDTGGSFIKIPPPEYEKFINSVKQKKDLITKDGYVGFYFAKCTSIEEEGWPTIKMHFADAVGVHYWTYLMGQDYLRQAEDECVLLV